MCDHAEELEEQSVRAAAAVPFAMQTVMVPMRDGIGLATDIYFPSPTAVDSATAAIALPVLVERTPYGKHKETLRERTAADRRSVLRATVAARFTQRGYVVVVQDCRGRYRSEGNFVKYLGEANDGADTLAWIHAQPWCNGKIGTLGMSYAAHTQMALASQRPAGLSAMFMECGGFANAFRGGIRHGGAFELKQATWAHKNALQSSKIKANPTTHAALASEDVAEWFLRMPWRRGHSPLRWAPEYEDYLFEQWEHGSFDAYWRQPELYGAGHYDALDGIPVMLMCGWWDPYAQTTTDNYMGLSNRPGSHARLTRLVLGPWTHGERSLSYAGDVDFGPQAVLDGNLAKDHFEFRSQWFDRCLKGTPAPVDDAPVRYFRMGGGTGRRIDSGRMDHGGIWQTATDWPVPQTALCNFYLHAEGLLSASEPLADASLTYTFDPAQPVPTIGGSVTSGEPLMFAGAYDQRTRPGLFGAREPYQPLSKRSDVLSFETAALDHDIEVTGSIVVRLWVSSSAPDTDFTAKLMDIYPPSADYPEGYAMNLTDGILRCRYRRSWEQPALLAPGEVAEISIEPMPTSNLFKKGHRIRLDISSSNFPRFDVNPNSGEPEGRSDLRQLATNTVYVSPAHPSHVVLPVIFSS